MTICFHRTPILGFGEYNQPNIGFFWYHRRSPPILYGFSRSLLPSIGITGAARVSNALGEHNSKIRPESTHTKGYVENSVRMVECERVGDHGSEPLIHFTLKSKRVSPHSHRTPRSLLEYGKLFSTCVND